MLLKKLQIDAVEVSLFGALLQNAGCVHNEN